MGARFIRLGIAGFKSFADALSIELLPGLTGIVGPNGCGKSNVAEALRWAMGEANARHLRGSEMDDIIFAGTANRASRNLAEVSLTIESTSGVGSEDGLPPPFSAHSELQVIRRIERGAGSSYRVNGREARARDVQTLFADLASGARSSAMISQGRVGLLVNARPEERRAVLEEAAGITGLHTRRAEAEGRLRAAEANLERAEDRRVALERQGDALRAQARQASRYRIVADAALEAEASLLALQQMRAEMGLVAAGTALERAKAGLQAASSAAELASAEAAAAQAAVPACREAEALARSSVERARLVQENVMAETARAKAALDAARLRQAQISSDLAHARTVVRDADEVDFRLKDESEQLLAQALDYPAALDAHRQAADAAARALHEADLAADETAVRAAEATAKISALQHVLVQAEGRSRRAEEAQARVLADRQRAILQAVGPARLEAAIAEREAAEAALKTAAAFLEQAEAARSRAAGSAALARDVHAQRDAIRHRLAAETAALAEVLAVKDGERWPPLLDSLSAPPGFEAALGAALGEELGAAANPGAARHWRAMPELAPRPLPGAALSDSVRGSELLQRALSGIGVVATDAEGDANQASLNPGQCLVSPAGALWRWDGYTVRAGTPTSATVRLQQRNRLADLRYRLIDAERDAKAALEARQSAQGSEQDARETEHRGRSALKQAESRIGSARAQAQSLIQQDEASKARLAAVEMELAVTAAEAATAKGALDEALQRRVALPEAGILRAAADAARTVVASARAQDNAATRALESLTRTEQARQARILVIAREREDRRFRAADLAGRVKDLEARHQEASRDEEQLAAAPAQAERHVELARSALQEAENAYRGAIEGLRMQESGAASATDRARAAEHAVFAAREALARAEGTAEAAEQAAVAMIVRLKERGGMLPDVPQPSDTSQAAEDRLRHKLQRLLRERDEIGPVNLRAEIEAAAIESEILTIVRERDELGAAIAKLRGSIGHLNREGRERLTVVFQAVDRNFQTLFSRMFGGGRAHLALVGSDDPLEAGLEIYAQPPGKKLTSLSLLSGGEQALTALSLIFAVFRCNPAPLCVLDEVDAPLDDANVERVCALLSDMAQETGTRFLVVTHHQVTMSRMDRLYGVTMQERGVSRLLSVDLSRAVNMIGAAAAE